MTKSYHYNTTLDVRIKPTFFHHENGTLYNIPFISTNVFDLHFGDNSVLLVFCTTHTFEQQGILTEFSSYS